MIGDEILLNRNFDEVKIVDDAKEKLEIAKEIIKNKDEEEPFYMFDVGEIIEQHKTLISKMPRVEPFYAIKCNPHPTVIKTMAALNTGFDCASKREIEMVMASGVSPERIIFAHTAKLNSHISLAKKVGVDMLVVDCEAELHKIKNIFPEAKIVIRFRCDAGKAIVLGMKFGCEADTVAPELTRIAKDLGLDIHGFSFNVGSQCTEAGAYGRGIKIALGLIEYARSLGFQNVKLLDIGGGFPSPDVCPIEGFAKVINEALKDADPSIRVISEPGRYLVSSPFTLASFVLGKKIVDEGDATRYIYYTNDGIFGSFLNSGLNIKYRLTPIPISESTKEKTHPAKILGPTPIAKDCIMRDCLLPELNIGDWLLWPNSGAYTLARARTMSGITPLNVYPLVKRKVWEQNPFLNRRL